MSNFPDPADRASALEELEREHRLAETRARAARSRMRPTGHCYNCEDRVGPADLFCDSDCRDGWERRRAAEKRNGSA